MATLQQTETRRYQKTIFDLHNPALLVDRGQNEAERRDIDRALRIASMLQTTLDHQTILDLFVAEARRLVAIDGVSYGNADKNLHYTIGALEKHSLTYRLTLADQSLGELTFTRKKRFAAKENKLLEYLLCGLVYPLRNAIAYQSALQAALRDPLTGVQNRKAMDLTMAREVELARRHSTPLSLIAIDIDYFKHINDSHGHATGDCVIRSVAEAISATVRGSDMVFRYGGEEFMVLLSNTVKEGAMQLAERIRRSVQGTEIACHGVRISATISLGVAWLENNDTGLILFNKADEALYSAKSAGRNCVRYMAG